MSKYSPAVRDWAIETYRQTHNRYPSRTACCEDIARATTAHINTVMRWITEAEGPPRVLTVEQVPDRMRDLQAEVERLRQVNLRLAEQVNAR